MTRLQNLLHRLHRVTGRQAVVLVDEYDKPILDVLDNSGLVRANRDYLRGFYGIIKGSLIVGILILAIWAQDSP